MLKKLVQVKYLEKADLSSNQIRFIKEGVFANNAHKLIYFLDLIFKYDLKVHRGGHLYQSGSHENSGSVKQPVCIIFNLSPAGKKSKTLTNL